MNTPLTRLPGAPHHRPSPRLTLQLFLKTLLLGRSGSGLTLWACMLCSGLPCSPCSLLHSPLLGSCPEMCPPLCPRGGAALQLRDPALLPEHLLSPRPGLGAGNRDCDTPAGLTCHSPEHCGRRVSTAASSGILGQGATGESVSRGRHTAWALGKATREPGALPKPWPLAAIHPSPRMADGPTSGAWGVMSRPFCPVKVAGSTERAPAEGLFSNLWASPDGGSWTSPGWEGPPGGEGTARSTGLCQAVPTAHPSPARLLSPGDPLPSLEILSPQPCGRKPRLQPHSGLLSARRSGNVGQRLLTWPGARATGRKITGAARGQQGPHPPAASHLHTDPQPQTGAACPGGAGPAAQHLHLCRGSAHGAPIL